MKLFIHIGLHKTGTTTFQTFLHHNRKTLINAGVFYPEMGEHESHWVLPNQLVRNNWDYVEDFMTSNFQTAKKKMLKQFLFLQKTLSYSYLKVFALHN